MKKLVIPFLILLLLTQLCGCVGGEVAPTQDPAGGSTAQPEQSPPPTATPEPAAPRFAVTGDLYQEDFFDEDGETLLLHAADDLPVVTVLGDQAASDAINAQLAARRETFLHAPSEYETGVDSAVEEARLIRQEGYTGESFALEQYYTVQRGDSAVLSFCLRQYSYLGGPHPNQVFLGRSFDAAGRLLSLDDLSADPAGFRDFCTQKVAALAEKDAGDGRYYEDYQTLLPANIRDDMWYFSQAGLTFLYNAYDIGSYAAGPFEFTIPYAELQGVMDARWLPIEIEANGDMTCADAENLTGVQPLLSLETDAEGSALVFTARGTVQNVSLYAAADLGGEVAENLPLVYLGRMADGECFTLRYLFPGDASCLSLRYTGAGGEQIARLVQLSGEDGSVLLLEP